MKVWPSSLDRMKNCMGYMTLQKRLREEGVDTSTTRAQTGVLAHIWIETWLRTGSVKAADEAMRALASQLSKEAGEELWTSEELVDLSLEMVEFSDWWREERRVYGQADMKLEHRVTLRLGDVEISGKLDCVVCAGEWIDIIDWKYYSDPGKLPPIDENLQMIAYAMAAQDLFGCREVYYSVVLVRQRFVQESELTPDKVSLVCDIASRYQHEPSTFSTGTWCSNCFVRAHCDEYKRMGEKMTTEIAPYTGQLVKSNEEALRYLLMLSAAKERLRQVEQDLREWAQNHGPIYDPDTNREWSEEDRQQDVILDTPGAIRALIDTVGVEPAMGAVKTSKASLEQVLKRFGAKPKERVEWLQRLRDNGIIERQPVTRFGWRKRREQ